MTLPDERWRAVDRARDFLRELLTTRRKRWGTRELRDRASRLLRHYPIEYETREALRRELEEDGP